MEKVNNTKMVVKYMKDSHPCKWERLEFLTEFMTDYKEDDGFNFTALINDHYMDMMIEEGTSKNEIEDKEICEQTYAKYQDVPSFTGKKIRSLSMGDIIEITRDYANKVVKSTYYCDNFGWTLIHEVSDLKSIEADTWRMIDTIRTVDIEQKVQLLYSVDGSIKTGFILDFDDDDFNAGRTWGGSGEKKRVLPRFWFRDFWTGEVTEEYIGDIKSINYVESTLVTSNWK